MKKKEYGNRVISRKDAGGAELKLVLVSSRSPEQKEEMDNDLRELAYYSLENEDTLLVSW